MSAIAIKSLLLASLISFATPSIMVYGKTTQTLKSKQVGDKISVITIGSTKIHTFHGISNSHIIETANELRIIDAQIHFKLAKALKKYADTLGKPLVQVILSHNHPDHWFGADIFAANTAIATSKNVMTDLKTGGMRYINIMRKKPKMKGIIPNHVIVPTVEMALGKQTWDELEVIVEEVTDQESHHSLLIKIPTYGVMIGQDLFYNNMFLVASERGRNKNWKNILKGLQTNEAKNYKTLLVGHGRNGGPSILAQNIEYLDVLEGLLAKGLSKEQTTKEMIAKFPKMRGKGLLAISMRNLFQGH